MSPISRFALVASMLLTSCASSYRGVQPRVDEARSCLAVQTTSEETFKSLTFYQLRNVHRLHVYVGANLVSVQPDGRERSHTFTLGLTTNDDLRELDERVAEGTLQQISSEEYAYFDRDAALRALTGAIAIHDRTIYKRYHIFFYAGLAFAPLLGRPCANVADDVTAFLAENPDRQRRVLPDEVSVATDAFIPKLQLGPDRTERTAARWRGPPRGVLTCSSMSAGIDHAP